MKNFFVTILLVLVLGGMSLVGSLAFAAEDKTPTGPDTDPNHQLLRDDASVALNPLRITDARSLISIAVRGVLMFIGSIALILYVWAGFLFMTAAGNAEKSGKAKNIFLWTTLGVVVMLGSYVIVDFVFTSLVKP